MSTDIGNFRVFLFFILDTAAHTGHKTDRYSHHQVLNMHNTQNTQSACKIF